MQGSWSWCRGQIYALDLCAYFVLLVLDGIMAAKPGVQVGKSESAVVGSDR